MPLLKPIRAIQLNRSHLFARGLVGCWLVNESSGSKVFDLSGNGNIGTLYGNTSWNAGKHGSCLVFDGTGDYVDCGTGSSLNITTEDFSISIWIKGNNPSQYGSSIHNIISKGVNNADGGYDIGVTASYLYARLEEPGYSAVQTYTPIAQFLDGYWHNVVTVYDRSDKCHIYLDGYEVSYISQPSISGVGNIGTGYPFRLSSDRYGSYNFNGQIDNAIIFNRVLSAEEVAHLFREPFCMFDVPTKQGLLYPAGQTVWLTAASTATASANGSLTRYRKLAGVVSSAAILSGILKLCYRGPLERQWLLDALFGGMTNNAFKLGSVMTSGWFWMRRAGCCALYRGPSMEQMDFPNILAVAEQDADSISPPYYTPHNSSSTYFYVVRRFNNCGYQERTLAAAVKVSIDSEDDLAKPQPNNIFTWRVDQVDGNKIELTWFYCPLEQTSRPVHFKVYYDSGTGLIDYQNPIATINFRGRRFYTYKSDALPTGRYLFAVRAEDADGTKNDSLAQLPIQININNPDSITILSIENI